MLVPGFFSSPVVALKHISNHRTDRESNVLCGWFQKIQHTSSVWVVDRITALEARYSQFYVPLGAAILSKFDDRVFSAFVFTIFTLLKPHWREINNLDHLSGRCSTSKRSTSVNISLQSLLWEAFTNITNIKLLPSPVAQDCICLSCVSLQYHHIPISIKLYSELWELSVDLCPKL